MSHGILTRQTNITPLFFLNPAACNAVMKCCSNMCDFFSLCVPTRNTNSWIDQTTSPHKIEINYRDTYLFAYHDPGPISLLIICFSKHGMRNQPKAFCEILGAKTNQYHQCPTSRPLIKKSTSLVIPSFFKKYPVTNHRPDKCQAPEKYSTTHQ